jgi:hypothetical protein
MGLNPIYTACIKLNGRLAKTQQIIDMMEFRADEKRHGTSYRERKSLCLLYYTDYNYF